jgi:hypothetical protein
MRPSGLLVLRHSAFLWGPRLARRSRHAARRREPRVARDSYQCRCFRATDRDGLNMPLSVAGSGLAKNDDVLHWKPLRSSFPGEREHTHFAADLDLAHFV